MASSSSIRLVVVCTLLCTLLMGAVEVVAASFVVPPDREMVRRSHAIVIASALTSYTQISAYGGIETVTPMSIEEVIKGRIEESIVNVHEPGGRYRDQLRIVFG